nr:condensation domain-containing protein [Kineosporia mesophila]
MTPAQEGILFEVLSGRERGDVPDVHTAQLVLDLQGPVDASRWRDAAQALLDRHPGLRAGFGQRENGECVALVAAGVTLPWQEIDLRQLPAQGYGRAAVEQELAGLLEHDRLRGFDPAAPPLLRATLYRLGPEQYRFVLTHHRLLLDRWSMRAVLGELLDPASAGTPSPVGTVRDSGAALRAWKEALSGLERGTLITPAGPPPTQLPGHLVRELDPALTARLHALAHDEQVDLGTVVQGAWALVLATLSGSDDVVFGVTGAGRPPGAAAIGAFASTVPVRIRIEPAQSPGTMFRRLRDGRDALPEHRHLGLAAIQQAAGVGELFDTVVLFDDESLGEGLSSGMDDVEITHVVVRDSSSSPLGLTVRPGQSLRLELEFAPDRIDAETAGSVLDRLGGALRQLSRGTISAVGRLDLLLEGERAGLLGARCSGEKPVQVPTSVLDVLREQAGTAPDAVALVTSEQRWTYSELQEWSGRVAAGLRATHPLNGEIVALSLPRAWMLPAMLAVMKTGAAVLPIDPGAPAGRTCTVLADAAPSIVIRSVEQLENAWFAATSVLPPVVPAAPAQIVYTSGSTGLPKGVVTTHAASANLLASHRRQLTSRHTGRLRLGHVQSFSSDASWDPVLWMLAGHQLHVIEESTYQDPDALITYLDRYGVDGIDVTPTQLGELLPAGLLEGRLKVLTVGGAAIDPQLWRQVCEDPGLRVYDLYGPTETTVDAYGWVGDTAGGRAPHRIDGVRTYLLDSSLRPVPTGVTGEVYVAGPGLALGYLNRPGLTAVHFVPDPFATGEQAGERMYRTGDRARWNSRGALELLGRADRQVQFRGVRLEPGEIEAALRDLRMIDRAAVTVREDTPGDQQLVAYVTTHREARPDEIRAALTGRLHRDLIPSTVVVLDRLPRGPGGEVDLRALAPARNLVRPRTEPEKTLAAAFAEVLGLSEVGIHDDFFELGGHSLLALRLAGLLRGGPGLRIGVRDIFEAPTVHQLARRLPGAPRDDRPRMRTIPQRPARVPLSDSQQRLWAHYRAHGPSADGNVPMTWRLIGALDVYALEAALGDVARRHQSLRTLVVPDPGSPHQVVRDEMPALRVLAVDGRPELGAALRREAGHGFRLDQEIPLRATLFRVAPDEHVLLVLSHRIAADEESATVLLGDLSTAYTARTLGQVPAPGSAPVQFADVMLWRTDQLGDPADPSSLFARQENWWRDQLAGLSGELDLPGNNPIRPGNGSAPMGESSTLPGECPSLPDRSSTLSHIGSARIGANSTPDGVGSARPGDRSTAAGGRAPGTGHEGGSEPFMIGAPLAEGLRAVAVTHDVSMEMLLQAAVAVLLSKLGAGEDVPLGSRVTGRGDPGLAPVVGPLSNLLVLRADTSGNPAFADVLARVRDTGLASLGRQDLPYERLEAALGGGPLFRVRVGYRADTERPLDLPGLSCLPVRIGHGPAGCDLSFDVVDLGRPGLDGSVGYRAGAFGARTAAGFGARLVRLLQQVAQTPGARLSKLDVLLPGEREQVTGEWAAGGPVPLDLLDLTVVDLLSRQARLTPHATALVTEQHSWTFAELEAWSNRAARVLLWAGPLRGRVVALDLDRAWTLPAILAVLKCGAAYVLDPEHFAEASPVLTLDSALLLEGDEDDSPLTDRERGGRLDADLPAQIVRDLVLPHAGIVHLAGPRRSASTDPDGEPLRVAHMTSFGSARAWGPVLWMLAGHQLHVLPEPLCHNPSVLAGYLKDASVDVLDVTAALLEPLMAAGLPEAGLSELLIDGRADPDLWRKACAVPGLTVRELYRPDGTVNAYGWQGDSSGARSAHRYHGLRTYILDGYAQPVPAGVTGELYVAGTGLAYGYPNRPAGTAGHFVADPFQTGRRMYRTGDRARWSADGVLQLLPRTEVPEAPRGWRTSTIDPPLPLPLPADEACRSMVIQLPADVDPERLQVALDAVIAAHPLMQSRLTATGLEISPRHRPCRVRTVLARGLDPQQLWAEIARQAGVEQAELRPRDGVMVRATRLDLGRGRPGRLLILTHALVADGVSHRILLSDLAIAYSQTLSGSIDLAPEGISFQCWADLFTGSVHELPQKSDVLGETVRLPVGPAVDRTTSVLEVGRELSAEHTAPLLTAVPAAYGATVTDILLAALALSVSDQRRRYEDGGAGQGHGGKARDEGSAGPSSSPRDPARSRRTGILVALERYGRDEMPALDLSRTVGQFTSRFPAFLDTGGIDLDAVLDTREAAASAVAQVRKNLSPGEDSTPDLSFTYLGHIDFPEPGDWSIAPETEAAELTQPAPYALTITAQIENRPAGPCLTVRWAWCEGVLTTAAVEDLADTWFRALTGLTRAAPQFRPPKEVS